MVKDIRLKKGLPRALVKANKDADWKKADRDGSAEAKRRAKGRCEVTVGRERCPRKDFETHHHIGGWKLRGRGASALAVNKTRCCSQHHLEIHSRLLEHLGGSRYRQVVG